MRKLLFIIGLMFCAGMIFAQTATLKIGTIYDPAPGPVVVPITLEALDNPVLGNNLISSWGWYISYDANVLGDNVVFNFNPVFPQANYLTNIVQDNPSPGINTIAIIYASAVSSPGTVGMTILDMTFTYASGNSDIEWTGLSGFVTNMADDEGNEFLLTLIDGYVGAMPYNILFQVTDNVGTPLQDAMVTVGTESILTDVNGEATFMRTNGTYGYAVTKTGYITVTNNFTIAGADITVPVVMNPVGTEFDVTFHVTDGTNDLQDALVTVGSQTALTDATGMATISLANGNYNYNVTKFGYSPASGAFTVANAPQTIDVILTPLPQYNITFHVTSGGNNVEGASIDIPGVGTMLTDINGNAVFSLIDGFYNYTITKTGYVTKTGSTTVAGAPFTIEETLIPLYEVTFHVTSGGADLAGASVTVGTATVVTNASGIAIFNLENGNYAYTVTKTGYNDASGNFTVASAPMTIDVAMTEIEYAVTFHVTDLVNNNLEGVLVSIDNGEFGTTDINGNVVIMLSNGNYVYTATKIGYYQEQDVFDVLGAPLTVEIDMTPEPTFAITFHVTALVGGANLAGAEVTVGTETITTNGFGIAVFNLPNGNYNYNVELLGYDPETGAFNVVNAAMTIEVPMELTEWPVTVHVTALVGGANLAGVSVDINGTVVLTGINGNALFNLVNGTYTYTATLAGYFPETGQIIVNNGALTVEVEMEFMGWETTFHCISGGVGLAGVAVTCNDTTITTNANGDALFYLQNGTYPYSAFKPGYIVNTGTVTVDSAAQQKNVLMVSQNLTFHCSSGGANISGVAVTIPGVGTQTSAANGNAVFSILPDGTYNYTATKAGYIDKAGTVIMSNASQTIQLYMQCVVTFEVWHAGSPVEGATVICNDSTLVTNASGIVIFNFENGTYTYNVTSVFGNADGQITVNGAPLTEVVNIDGIDEFTANNIKVYPNPSQGNFFIEMGELNGSNGDVTVYNLTGNVVYTSALQDIKNNKIDLSAQQAGSYILQIRIDGKKLEKVIIIR
jgi:uncharacterized membrane protein